MASTLAMGASVSADQPATVTEVVNDVERGSQGSTDYSPASKGTPVHDGQDVKTGIQSRAELRLPTTSITRLGANTIFNYSVETNTIDLQAGTILFCKPKDAPHLNVKTAAVTAGIVGTTGFISIRGEGSKATYVLGIIEGHATATADGHPFLIGSGDILEFKSGIRPFVFAYDLPRFVKSSALVNKFKGTLPNQAYIDRAVASYQEDASRGFITSPSHSIDYSGDIPILSTTDLSSAMNSLNPSSKGAPPPPPQQSSSPGYNGNSFPGNSSYH